MCCSVGGGERRGKKRLARTNEECLPLYGSGVAGREDSPATGQARLADGLGEHARMPGSFPAGPRRQREGKHK